MIERLSSPVPITTNQPTTSTPATPPEEIPNPPPEPHNSESIDTNHTNQIQHHATYNFSTEVSFGELASGLAKAFVALTGPAKSVSVLADPQIRNPYAQHPRQQEERPLSLPPVTQGTEANQTPRDDEDVRYI